MSFPLNKTNHNDPLITQGTLVQNLFADVPLAHERIVHCVRKGYLSKLDLLYLEEKLRLAQCAVIGLLHSVEHDKPILLPEITNNDKTTSSS